MEFGFSPTEPCKKRPCAGIKRTVLGVIHSKEVSLLSLRVFLHLTATTIDSYKMKSGASPFELPELLLLALPLELTLQKFVALPELGDRSHQFAAGETEIHL